MFTNNTIEIANALLETDYTIFFSFDADVTITVNGSKESRIFSVLYKGQQVFTYDDKLHFPEETVDNLTLAAEQKIIHIHKAFISYMNRGPASTLTIPRHLFKAAGVYELYFKGNFDFVTYILSNISCSRNLIEIVRSNNEEFTTKGGFYLSMGNEKIPNDELIGVTVK